MSGLGRVQLLQAKYKEAATTLAEALKAYERALPKSWERYKCEVLLGASLAGERKYQEAEPLLVSGYDGMAERRATMPPDGRADLEYTGAQIVQLHGAFEKAGLESLPRRRRHRQGRRHYLHRPRIRPWTGSSRLSKLR